MQSRRLWIIDYDAFGFGWLCSTQRLFALSRALQTHAWHTTLLSARRTAFKRHPFIERAFPGQYVQLPFLEDACPRAWNRACIRTIWIRTHRRVERPQGYLEAYWTPGLERWVKQRAVESGSPHAVWGISYGRLRSVVVARHMSEALEVPLVIEFQDPCPPPGEELGSAQMEALQDALRRASAIVTTTSAYAEELRRRHPDIADKVHVVYLSMPPALPEAAPGAMARDQDGVSTLKLLYTGTLSRDRNESAKNLVAALPLLFQRRPESAGRVRLRFIGWGQGLTEALAESRRLSLGRAVSVRGQASPDTVWREVAKADCLVLIRTHAAGTDMQIPGKTFYYMAAHKPILALTEENETAAILRSARLGLIAPPGDRLAIADRLVDLWDAKTEGASITNPDHDYISRFSEENMGRQVSKLLEGAARWRDSASRS